MLLLVFIIFSLLKENAGEDVIKPAFTQKHVLEGNDVTLICSYTVSVNNLQWYRQYPGSKPEHLIMFFETKSQSEPALRLNATANKAAKKNAGEDVIKPVLTEKQVLEGNDVTLICSYTGTVRNLQWYRQYPGSKPEHLIMFFETKSQSEPALRLTAAADKAAKSMTLTISSTEVKDSAMYYCALEPTVTGNTTALYKNRVRNEIQDEKQDPYFKN
ncbi:hypothetical protein G5714_001967 [Onychostoma macrolepis]|uniref:Ig-like domain-containing protein n=1 Tax=Onychostoma macrolepis TaxID=369639 RepID=A0A7J6DF46_9TELE|nr:hypothetical protein G5714_001967 [Onychostoma macrolepis]